MTPTNVNIFKFSINKIKVDDAFFIATKVKAFIVFDQLKRKNMYYAIHVIKIYEMFTVSNTN